MPIASDCELGFREPVRTQVIHRELRAVCKPDPIWP